MRIGVDAGGTFTDFVVLHEDGRLETFKLRSDPAAPAKVILAGLARAAGDGAAEVVHGSTVGTNALLERKGARTALVTTAGFEDLVFIGRQNRAELYNLAPAPRRWLVSGEMCFGVGERAHYDGTIERRPSEREMARLRKALAAAGAESVAICFLHAYRTVENERAVAEALRGIGYISASNDVCPEFREYERASTTLINAYVGPLMDRYLGELERGGRRIAILQSNGGTLRTAEARRHAVRTILSGPAGGAIGAFETARASGFTRILGFDMGGTFDRREPVRRRAARDDGRQCGWVPHTGADAGYSHGWSGRRVDRAGGCGRIAAGGAGERGLEARAGVLRER